MINENIGDPIPAFDGDSIYNSPARYTKQDKYVCKTCKKEFKSVDEEFRNAMSVKEWNISEMCQTCQDSIFGED